MKLETEILTMEYPLLGGAPAAVTEPEPAVDLPRRVQELEKELEERERQFGRKLESARQEAMERGRQQAGGEQAAWRQQAAAAMTAALDGLRARTDEYLAQVEQEVVRLALGVAERILHRESQLDPLLLSGAVRVALGQLAESAKVRLRVPAGQQGDVGGAGTPDARAAAAPGNLRRPGDGRIGRGARNRRGHDRPGSSLAAERDRARLLRSARSSQTADRRRWPGRYGREERLNGSSD